MATYNSSVVADAALDQHLRERPARGPRQDIESSDLARESSLTSDDRLEDGRNSG